MIWKCVNIVALFKLAVCTLQTLTFDCSTWHLMMTLHFVTDTVDQDMRYLFRVTHCVLIRRENWSYCIMLLVSSVCTVYIFSTEVCRDVHTFLSDFLMILHCRKAFSDPEECYQWHCFIFIFMLETMMMA